MVSNLMAAVVAAGLGFGASESAVPKAEPVSPKAELLEQAARQFRIQVYNTFHADRAEYDRRRAEWNHIEAAWLVAGKPEQELPILVQWLETATTQSLPESFGPLPESPQFAAEAPVSAPVLEIPELRIVVPAPDEHQPQPGSVPAVNSEPAATLGAPAATATSPTLSSSNERRDSSAAATTLNLSRPASDAPDGGATPVSAVLPPSQPIAPDASPDEASRLDSSEMQRGPAWMRALASEVSDDLNSLALTLAWKREPKNATTNADPHSPSR